MGTEVTDATDYNIKVSVRNGRLLARIRGSGFKSIKAFCSAHNISYGTVGELICLRRSGLKPTTQEWRKVVLELANIFDCLPQDLIPKQHWEESLAKSTFELAMTSEQAAGLVGGAATPDNRLVQADLEKLLESKLKELPPRYEKVVRMRYGLTEDGVAHTMEECAQELGMVSRERIRQIEKKALDLLKRRELKVGDGKLKLKTRDVELESYIKDIAERS